MKKYDLTFQEDDHIYRVNGLIVPSCTQILAEWIKVESGKIDGYVNTRTGTFVESERFERAQILGSAIHKTVHYNLKGTLDREALAHDLLAPLFQFSMFMQDSKAECIETEFRGYLPEFGVAGTLDIFARVPLGRNTSRYILIDIKTGGVGISGAQTAFYERMYRQETGFKKFIDRYCLILPRDGSPYSLIPLTNKRDLSAFKFNLGRWQYYSLHGGGERYAEI